MKPLSSDQLYALSRLSPEEKRCKKLYWIFDFDKIGAGYILDDSQTTYDNRHLNLDPAFKFFENFWHAWAYLNRKHHENGPT